MFKNILSKIQFKNLAIRFYIDFFMPSRLPLYEELLITALNQGYQTCSIISFWRLIIDKQIDPTRKYLILRHDIDSDIKTAIAFWELEKKLGVQSSFYFRLSTLDIPLMQKIEQSGSEASYHYEEIATVAKERGLRTQRQIQQNLMDIQMRFKTNYHMIKHKSGLRMATVASHGDFVNRKLSLPNHYLLESKLLRDELQIELETYDLVMMQYVTSRHSDTQSLNMWQPNHPLQAIMHGEKVVYILTHPRQWHVSWIENLKDNLQRVWEGLHYSLFCRLNEWLCQQK
ncbi:MAG: hypothetical protein U0350_03750 [Caldilineaceae bacterium]